MKHKLVFVIDKSTKEIFIGYIVYIDEDKLKIDFNYTQKVLPYTILDDVTYNTDQYSILLEF